MLTPAQLDRVGQGYRSGYRDGADGKPMRDLSDREGTFYAYDYREGYKAGQNDKRGSKR